MTDTILLRESIQNSGYKIGFIAEKCGVSRATLSKKINNKSYFTQKEIATLCELLEISPGIRNRIFFA